MQKQQLESRPVDSPAATGNAQPSDVVNSNLGGIKRFIKRESPLSEDANGPVRINRAARLRAAATSATPPPVEDKSGETLEPSSFLLAGEPFSLFFSLYIPSRSKDQEAVGSSAGNLPHCPVGRRRRQRATGFARRFATESSVIVVFVFVADGRAREG